MADRLKFWGWGLEKDVLGADEIERMERAYAKRFGLGDYRVVPTPKAEEIELRRPRIPVPGALSDVCSTDHFERLLHSYGQSFYDSARAFARDFSNPPDVIAFPRSEPDVVSVLDWCDSVDAVVIPWGGGSSVVGGVEPPRSDRPAVTLDLKHLGKVLGDRSDLAGGAHPGWNLRAGPGESTQGERAHAAAFPAVLRVLHPGRMDRHAQRGPLRDALHPHRRLRREFAGGNPQRCAGVVPPPRLWRRAEPGSHVHRLRGNPGHHHRSLDAVAAPADLPRQHQRPLRGFLPGGRVRARHRPVPALSSELPAGGC